jgi:hypothetical protein
MYDERTNLARQVVEDIREHFGDKVFHTVVPRNIRLGEAPSFGKPVLSYDIKSRGAEAYIALAREFLKKRKAHDDDAQTRARPWTLGSPAGKGRRSTWNVSGRGRDRPPRSFPIPATQGLFRGCPQGARRLDHEQGIVQPIVVVSRGEKFEIVAGERRWRAARLAGLRRFR